MSEKYSAGIVTAYGAAVKGGYTGTYEDFCRHQAKFAENAEQVAEDRATVERLTATFESDTIPQAILAVENVGREQNDTLIATGAAQAESVTDAGTVAVAEVNQAGETQVSAVQEEGTTQIGLVTQEGTEQVEAVTAEGTTQKGLVTDEGATQVNNVQAKGDEVLASIPEDFTELTGEVNQLKEELSETNERLVQQQKGEVYILGNVQADHYIRENTGKLTGYTGWSATDFLSCHSLDFLYISATSISRNYNAFYSDLDETTYISSFVVSVGENKIAVPENAKYYRLSNTANALLEEKVYTATQAELDIAKKDIAELRVAAGNSTSGVFTSNSRAIYVPFTFELGKTYKINFADSAQTVTHLKVLSDRNLNAESVIHQWSVNGNSYETKWKCDTVGGLYLLLLSASDVESNSTSVYIHDISEMTELLSLSRIEEEVVPGVDGITFRGNTKQSDPLIVTIPRYFWRNENASYTNAYSSATGGEYSLGHNEGLYYNVNTHELAIFSTSSPIDTAYILLLWKQTTVIKGAWAFYYYDAVLRGDINQLSENVSVISEKISGAVPAYYNVNDYLTNKIKRINENQPLNGVSFAFITDLHFKSNALVSLPLLEHMLVTTPVDIILSGGDYTAAYGDTDDLWYAYSTELKYAKNLYPNWFSARGNHDYTLRTSSSASTGITWGDAITKSGIIKSMADWRYDVIEPKIPFIDQGANVYTNYCWTLTNEQEKVKILYLCDFDATDTTTYFGVIGVRSNAYCTYLGQMLKETDGYTVIVLTHAPLTNELVGGINSKITNVVTAFANRQSITLGTYSVDFTQSTGVLAACISGHSHRDQYTTVNGVLHINTTCDACYADDGYGGTIGTITEQAFDVLIIDTSARTIKAVRIGRGNDREWSY